MNRSRLSAILCLLACWLCAPVAAQTPLRVNESATRVTVESGHIVVALAVNNAAPRRVASRLKLELLDTQNQAQAIAESDEIIQPGANPISASLAGSSELAATLANRRQELFWYRLRYQLTPGPSGIVALSAITPDLFEISLSYPAVMSDGGPFRARVRAAHPLTERPMSGVRVTCTIEPEGENAQPLKASAITGDDGFAACEFDLPRHMKGERADVTARGARNGVVAETSSYLEIDSYPRLAVSTDKPLYQPGQMLHLRALVFDSTRHAVVGGALTIKVSDPEDTIIYRATATTSRFGVASADWAIPDNVRLGDYEIRCRLSDAEEFTSYPLRVRISRYDLPNFAVTVKPNRAYYLGDQNAEVMVRGDYLFGQPLARGHVRVVRETSRDWNFREQKWEIEEEDKLEGELDAAGRFVARFDLSKAHRELAESGYNRFRDVSYVAYITDATTGRTEQRRFDLRVTKEPIHVYVISNTQQRRAPLDFYVSTFYADGSPAECEVTINEAIEVSGRKDKEKIARPLLRTVQTNRYGVAKVSRLVGHTAEPAVRVTARDRRGAVGHETEDFSSSSSSSSSWLRVETDRAIYRPGQPVRAVFRAAASSALLFVDLIAGGRVIRSEQLALRRGEAHLTFDYTNDFKGEVTVAAYIYDEDNDAFTAQRAVLYPVDSELKLEVKMSAAGYRPGEEASAAFNVRTADQGAVSSVLGVAVIDRAVVERARTDVEFLPRQSFAQLTQQVIGSGNQIAGITLDQLNKVDLSKPIPDDLDLVAEVLLQQNSRYAAQISKSQGYHRQLNTVFGQLIRAQMQPIKAALDRRYLRTGQYPTDAAQLASLLDQFGINWREVRDAWGNPYRADFAVERDRDVLRLESAGADKRFNTGDDFVATNLFWFYFAPHSKAIDRALGEYHRRTGQFVRDRDVLRVELRRSGVDLDRVRDRWSQPYEYRFGVSGKCYTLTVVSGGPNRRLEHGRGTADDFSVFTTQADYFADRRPQIDAALTVYFKAHNRLPQNDAELNEALRQSHITRADLRDGWDRPLYATFKSESRFGDHVRIYSYAAFGEPARQKTEVTPVTQFIAYINLRSVGADGKAGTPDDFDLGNYSRVVGEQAANEPVMKRVLQAAVNTGPSGALAGLVVDPQGAVIAGAKVQATDSATMKTYEATTNDEGRFLLRNLPASTYEVRVESPGFNAYILSGVPVQAGNVTEINAALAVSATSETVVVAASAEAVQTEHSQSYVAVVVGRALPVTTKTGAAMKPPVVLSTPRLREYFPETLVWQPSIETDKQGRASLKFKLADNITTWKLAVIASTVDGRIGVAETDVLAFQPFFVEHDPPHILTAGDEIALPVVVRNYLDHKQTVALDFSPAAWFQLLSAPRQQIEVNAGDAARATFDFRATASVKAGAQRVTATSAEAADAIEKKVAVHPDGEEIATTASQVFGAGATITLDIPERAIADTARGELKIYPNLSAHVLEAIEAIMQRPYGCAEQSISSAYPSLLALRLYAQRGEDVPPVAQRARRYVQAGYERLLSYRDEAGGFTYWGRGRADAALTAYALQFLNDAARFIAIDGDVKESARNWLIKQQRADGSWPAYDWRGKEDRARTALLTALVTRALAQTVARQAPQSSDRHQAASPDAALNRALDYLSSRAAEIDEPYMIASFALAAMEARQNERAAQAIARLTALARQEKDTTYWTLETNTPFYGWGLAGRVETTALAVQALASRGAANDEAQQRRATELINRGLLFLLRQQDRYGVWYSTQATVQALAALAATLSEREVHATSAPDSAEIIVNGKRAMTVAMPRSDELTSPFTIDVSSYLSVGSNRVEIRRAATASQASAQLVTSHYERWDEPSRPRESPQALRLKVAFDKTELKAGDDVTCHVEAERVGFQGYGMMLAEIGLPPGADVDRASLERAMTESNWEVSQYDVLPDRLIVYLWPRAGGTRFAFKFKPRYGLKAQTAPSMLYDYYNPEARATLAPSRFHVR
ncbi:MAG: MG2 domain-containing protein [Blastocatellia bacterium]